jgi:transposase-like protein
LVKSLGADGTFCDFPEAHWKHLPTANVVESSFAVARDRTTAAKRLKKVANATALIGECRR